MDSVHVYVSTGRFKSFTEMRAYIDESYTEDGDGIPSMFMTETGLTNYEPGCIEAIPSSSGQPVPVASLLRDASYASQWLHRIDGTKMADAAICVYSPNVLATPASASLEYLGEFAYAV